MRVLLCHVARTARVNAQDVGIPREEVLRCLGVQVRGWGDGGGAGLLLLPTEGNMFCLAGFSHGFVSVCTGLLCSTGLLCCCVLYCNIVVH